METTPVTTVPITSNTKKIILFSIVGVVLILSILAAFIPAAKDTIITLVKLLLESVKVFL